MEVVIRPNAEAATDLVARIIARELRDNPRLAMGLATGRTMESVYGRLVQMHREEGLDFSTCHTFNLDEYVGLPSSHRNSYRHYMNHNLFLRVNVDLRNTHLPDGMATDIEAECERYEKVIAQCGGIDLQLLGIGLVGHLGFNEPASSLRSRTRIKVLSPMTCAQNAPQFEPPEKMPRRAITMGVSTILNARRCLLLATGKDKAEIVARAIEGPVTSMISATALQFHPHCTVVLDEAAASRLLETDYYHWIFENEPQWQVYRDKKWFQSGRPSSQNGSVEEKNVPFDLTASRTAFSGLPQKQEADIIGGNH
ncbi:MAG TPA: glucosamine-6-phosphate deaminase [Verrucomicrobiae bacterium]|nr:glucosamine-6-phosphate deaminase [Verrucomicrobiae bacterium]